MKYTFNISMAILLSCAGIILAKDKPMERKAHAKISALGDSKVQGEVTFTEVTGKKGVKIEGTLSGLKANSMHGFHIHQNGDCSAKDGSSAGGHFAMAKEKHGSLNNKNTHVGDLGNIKADKDGKAMFSVVRKDATLEEGKANSILGKSMIVHAGQDDLKSQPSGASGDRIACGVIDKK